MNALVFVLPPLGGLVLYVIIRALVRSPGAYLQARFARVGRLEGRHATEITRACGNPTGWTTYGNGMSLWQWQATGFHIALLIDPQGFCRGVTHQYSVAGVRTSTSTQAAAGPGWYQAGTSGQLRWWDGSRWTEDVQSF